MRLNTTIKIALTIFIVDTIENILLLLLFGVPLTQQTFIAIGVFTFALTLVFKFLKIYDGN